jgi:putative oxidoreductase
MLGRISMTMTEARPGPRRIVPFMSGFYDSIGRLGYPVIRVTVGALFIPHFLAKMNAAAGVAGLAQAILAKRGIEPALPLMYLVMITESVGAACLILGLFTRIWAAAVVIECAVLAIAVHNGGFAFTTQGGGFEFPLLWGLVAFGVFLKGGGPYSLDRAIGWEF